MAIASHLALHGVPMNPSMRAFISGFHSISPAYSREQAQSLQWIAAAHGRFSGSKEISEKLIERYGCSPESIGRRGTELSDFTHTNWENMRIFKDPQAGLKERQAFYAEAADRVFKGFYPAEGAAAPDELIHVTCTGYLSPSAAQKRVSTLGWGAKTKVTHAYHMGCYASLPAIRIAQGFAQGLRPGGRIDVVHTELCSLHFNPSLTTPEQLVVQSLFADGFIRYSVSRGAAREAGFEVVDMREEIIPGTEGDMTWMPADPGFEMTLSRHVPAHIAEHLEAFVDRLLGEEAQRRDEVIFAIHPGGPKIIDRVSELLRLKHHQSISSRKVLFEAGNMSSATLPHIWREVLAHPEVLPGTPVLSLAFGPGLTVSGALFRKVGAR